MGNELDHANGAASDDADETTASVSEKRGRPRKLKPDAHTLGKIEGMASTMATEAEIAALLLVDKTTFIAFKQRHREVGNALKRGRAFGKIRLRRLLFKSEDARTLIHLGEKYLGQRVGRRARKRTNTNRAS